jgi:hypothetical protein
MGHDFKTVVVISGFFIFATILRSDPAGIQVVPGNIKDTRATEQHPGTMEVELNVLADNSTEAMAYRVIMTKAVDDTGVDLISPQSAASEFQSFDSKRSVKAKLKSPARSAAAIKELSGDVELFCPKKDPAATVIVNAFRKHTGTPIESATLKAAKIQVAAWTSEEYQALEGKREAKMSEAERTKRRQARNDFVFTINGAREKLIGFEFRDRTDKTIPSRGSGVMYKQQGPQIERTLWYHFEGRLPDTTKLVIFVATPGSLVKMPFTLADVALP